MIQMFSIPFRLIGLNEYTKMCRGNMYAANKEKQDIEIQIMSCLRGMKQCSKPVTISFTWYEKNKKRDKDNVCFAKKFILDALQKANIIKNDNNGCVVGFSDDFIYCEGDGVEVILEEV